MKDKEFNIDNYYVPADLYIVLQPETITKSGIHLPSGNGVNNSLALEIVAIGPKVTKYKKGDMIMFDGNAFQFTITIEEINREYYQIHEANIIAKVMNGAKVNATVPNIENN